MIGVAALVLAVMFVGVFSYRRSGRVRGAPVHLRGPLVGFDSILKDAYPVADVTKMLEVGADLPRAPAPPWFRFRARHAWIRRLSADISFANIYGWRTNKGNARPHTHVSKFTPPTRETSWVAPVSISKDAS